MIIPAGPTGWKRVTFRVLVLIRFHLTRLKINAPALAYPASQAFNTRR